MDGVFGDGYVTHGGSNSLFGCPLLTIWGEVYSGVSERGAFEPWRV